MKTSEYLAAAKRRLKISSAYALAKRLEISDQAVAQLLRGDHAMSVTTAAKVAEILDLDPLKVIADIELERGTNDELWKRIAKRVAVLVLPAIASAIAPMPSAEASVLQSVGSPVYYVKRRPWSWLLGLPGFAGDDDQAPA